MTTIHWTGGASTNWTDAANWNSGLGPVPGSGDNVLVDLANGGSPYIVNVNGAASAGALSVISNAILSTPAGSSLSVSGAIVNDGEIRFSGAAWGGSSFVINGAVTLSGAGSLALIEGGNGYAGAISGGLSGSTLDNKQTIYGGGTITAGAGLALTNDTTGVINGTQLLIQGVSIVNKNLLESSAVDGLTLQSLTVTNTGTIKALTGSSVDLNSAVVIGGTLATVGTGQINLMNSSTLDGSSGGVAISSGSSIQMAAGTHTTLAGTIANAGTLTLNGAAWDDAHLYISGTVTLSGSGGVTMVEGGNGYAGSIQGVGGGSTLHNEQTIYGGGTIAQGAGLTLVNETTGVINGTQLLIDQVAIDNKNLLEASAADGLTLNKLTVTNAGTIIALDGASVDLTTATIIGGTLTSLGSGQIKVTSNATLDGSSGGLTITSGSNIRMGAGAQATLLGSIGNSGTFTLSGSASDDARLNISGAVTLSGAGAINMVEGGNGHAGIISGVGSGGALVNQQTISGGGAIAQGVGLTLLNDTTGVINGTQLLIDQVAITNLNLMEASAADGLTLNKLTVTNSGTIMALDGASVDLTTATIIGGALTSLGSGQFKVTNATLDGSSGGLTITSGSNIRMGAGAQATLLGSIGNSGTFTLSGSASDDARLNISGSVTLSGAGAINMVAGGNGHAGLISGAAGGGTLVNQQTISGSGGITSGYGLSLINDTTGVIGANSLAGSLTIAPAILNNGVLSANGGTLVVQSAVTGTGRGSISNGGTLQLLASFDEAVTFNGANAGELSLAQQDSGTISGFSLGDYIDLAYVGYADGMHVVRGAQLSDYATYLLEGTDGSIVSSLNLVSTLTGGAFKVTNEGGHALIALANLSTVVPSDFDSQGVSDVLFRDNSSGDTGYYQLNADGTFQGWHSLGASSTAYAIVGTGDFTGAGHADVLFRDNATGDTGFYKLDANGSLQSWVDIGASSTAYSVTGIGDFNADGLADILYRDNASGDTGFYQLNSDGSFNSWHSLGASSTAYTIAGVGDFNGDGVSDVLFQNKATGDTGYYQLNSDGSFNSWHGVAVASTAYTLVGTGDFNGDGVSDVLFRDNAGGDIGFYQMNSGGTVQGWHDIGASSTSYSVAAIGDYNGDGSSDILFRSAASGDTGFYQLNADGTYQGWHSVGASSTAYSIIG